MRVVGKMLLEDYAISHADAKIPLSVWLAAVEGATWRNIVDVRMTYPQADFVKGKTVFNIKGKRYRLITIVNYELQLVSIDRCMTHTEYDKGKWE